MLYNEFLDDDDLAGDDSIDDESMGDKSKDDNTPAGDRPLANNLLDDDKVAEDSREKVIDNGLVTVGLSKKVVVNQLQFDCRELRQEIRGLSLFYNSSIWFMRPPLGQCVQMCINFTRTLSEKQLSKIRFLVVTETSRVWRKFQPLLDFCGKNPHILLEYHLGGVRHEPGAFMLTAAQYAAVLKRENPLIGKLNVVAKQILTLWAAMELLDFKLQVVDKTPDNFRVFPCGGQAFDAIEFRRFIGVENPLLELVLSAKGGDMETFVESARNFAENGW